MVGGSGGGGVWYFPGLTFVCFRNNCKLSLINDLKSFVAKPAKDFVPIVTT